MNRNGKIDSRVLAEHGSRLIAVDDTIAALGRLGAYHRGRGGARVIAVTGSNGKTTTKRMIQHILAKHLRGTCSPKSFNNNIGVPLTLLGAGEEDDYVVCEVGSNAPGEIAELSAICRPDLAVIVSVGETHLEKLGGIDQVAVEKASMLRHLRPGGCAIVWADSPPLAYALKPFDCRLVRFGQAQDADLRLTDFQGQGDRVSFRVNGNVEVRLPQPGRHNACNAGRPGRRGADGRAHRAGGGGAVGLWRRGDAAGVASDRAGASHQRRLQRQPLQHVGGGGRAGRAGRDAKGDDRRRHARTGQGHAADSRAGRGDRGLGRRAKARRGRDARVTSRN